MNIFLEKLSKKYSKNYILLTVDNASWHKSKTLKIPENIELFPLLPYTPELNPIEQIWDDLREKFFRNELFDSLDSVIDRLVLALLYFMENFKIVNSITFRKWMYCCVLKTK